MRFLGKVRIPKTGVDLRFSGQVVTRKLIRPEGVCIKHWLNHNTLKMYDKQSSVLRVETTINDTSDFRVHRASEADPSGPKKLPKLRKGVIDLPRRAEISQAANQRYLAAQAAVDSQVPLGKIADKLAKPVLTTQSRSRGLTPLTGIDSQLIAILLRGEFHLNGFRNRDPPVADERLLPTPKAASNASPATSDDATALAQRRRQSGQVTRLLRLFRAHDLIRKIPHTQRYQLTANPPRRAEFSPPSPQRELRVHKYLENSPPKIFSQKQNFHRLQSIGLKQEVIVPRLESIRSSWMCPEVETNLLPSMRR